MKKQSITDKIKKAKVGKPKTIPLEGIDVAVVRTMAQRLNSEIKGATMPMYSIHKDSYRDKLVIIKNF